MSAISDGLLSILVVIAILLVAGLAFGLIRRDLFSPRWLLVAAGLVFIHDVLLTNGYGLLPDLIGASEWNWQGKLLALALTLAIATHPAFGWRRSGLTLAQNPEGRAGTYIVCAVLLILFGGLALLSPNGPPDNEALAFQLTMPGLEEETFYRGILLLALNEAFRGRMGILGTTLGWGALLSSALFGLDHAMSADDGKLAFDAMTMALTGGPALILVWLRERTGSLLLPILLHNFANSAGMII